MNSTEVLTVCSKKMNTIYKITSFISCSLSFILCSPSSHPCSPLLSNRSPPLCDIAQGKQTWHVTALRMVCEHTHAEERNAHVWNEISAQSVGVAAIKQLFGFKVSFNKSFPPVDVCENWILITTVFLSHLHRQTTNQRWERCLHGVCLIPALAIWNPNATTKNTTLFPVTFWFDVILDS